MIKKEESYCIEFRRLEEINKEEIIDLMNLPLVRRHLPLAKEPFDEKAYEAFITEKNRLWLEHGYGPWAFVVDGKFIGWGGLQFEQGDADLALILHPSDWGLGRTICREIIKKAFNQMGFESITILLPPTRKRLKGLSLLNFKTEGELTVDGERFLRFRLTKRGYSGPR
jgi:hypothetical protein